MAEPGIKPATISSQVLRAVTELLAPGAVTMPEYIGEATACNRRYGILMAPPETPFVCPDIQGFWWSPLGLRRITYSVFLM